MTRPLIGITLDAEPPSHYATVPWYALRKNYADAIHAAGGTPVFIPHHIEHTERYINLIDGLVLSGGHFDIPPHLYGEEEAHPTVKTKSERTECEWALGKLCFEMKKPILGICGGMQLMNVILGGTLIQDIQTCHTGGQEHLQKPPYALPHHTITITKGSILHSLIQKTTAEVNSSHHQAVGKVAPGMVATAFAPDGIIEAIEYENSQYCHGVQWHPEYHVGELDKRIFDHFVAAC